MTANFDNVCKENGNFTFNSNENNGLNFVKIFEKFDQNINKEQNQKIVSTNTLLNKNGIVA